MPALASIRSRSYKRSTEVIFHYSTHACQLNTYMQSPHSVHKIRRCLAEGTKRTESIINHFCISIFSKKERASLNLLCACEERAAHYQCIALGLNPRDAIYNIYKKMQYIFTLQNKGPAYEAKFATRNCIYNSWFPNKYCLCNTYYFIYFFLHLNF